MSNRFNEDLAQRLTKYGLTDPKFREAVKKRPNQITINNNTVTNEVGPIQGRNINIKDNSSTGNFKSWLELSFINGKSEKNRIENEFNRKEGALTRGSAKLMSKFESFGKLVAQAVDPRTKLKRETNQLKVLLKTIGFISFARMLPSFVRAFGKFKSFLSSLSNKDKKGNNFFSKFKLDLSDKTIRGLLGKLSNPSETGVLDILLKRFVEGLNHRVRLANIIKSTYNFDNAEWGEAGRNFLGWLGIVLGGDKVAKLRLDDKTKKRAGSNLEMTGERGLNQLYYHKDDYMFYFDKKFGDLKKFEGMAPVYKRNEISTTSPTYKSATLLMMDNDSLTDKVQKDFKNWKHKIAKSQGDFIKEQIDSGADIYCQGEARVLLNRLLMETLAGKSTIEFNKKLDMEGDRLRQNQLYYGSLALTLFTLYQFKKKGSGIMIENIIYLLKVLINSGNGYKSMPMFTEFLKCFDPQFKSSVLKNRNIVIKYSLIKEPISDKNDQNRYEVAVKYGVTKYLKIYPTTLAKNENKSIVSYDGKTEWNFPQLTGDEFNDFLKEVLDIPYDINYTKECKKKLYNLLKKNKAIGNKKFVYYSTSGEDSYDQVLDEIDREMRYWNELKESNELKFFSGVDEDDEDIYEDLDFDANVKVDVDKNGEIIYKFLRSKGLTRVQALAIMGSMWKESRFNPTAINKGELENPKKGKSFAGEGIVQWTSTRKDKILDRYREIFKKEPPPQGIVAIPLKEQLQLFWDEFSGSAYDSVRDNFSKNKDNLRQATTIFYLGFEAGLGHYSNYISTGKFSGERQNKENRIRYSYAKDFDSKLTSMGIGDSLGGIFTNKGIPTKPNLITTKILDTINPLEELLIDDEDDEFEEDFINDVNISELFNTTSKNIATIVNQLNQSSELINIIQNKK